MSAIATDALATTKNYVACFRRQHHRKFSPNTHLTRHKTDRQTNKDGSSRHTAMQSESVAIFGAASGRARLYVYRNDLMTTIKKYVVIVVIL